MLIVVVTDWIWMDLLASLFASLLVCFAFACIHWNSGAPPLAYRAPHPTFLIHETNCAK